MGIKEYIIAQINHGISFTDDRLVQKKVQKTNIFSFCLTFYYLFLFCHYLSLGENLVAITAYIVILKLVMNLVLFRIIKKIKLYSFLLILILALEVCKGLLYPEFKGLGLIGVGVTIIVSLSIIEIKIGSIFCILLILLEVFTYIFNSRIPFIFKYPETLNLLLFRSIGAHIGLFIFTYISIKKQDEVLLQLENEKIEKDNLFVNIVHDIKTPLTIIQNSIDGCINKNDSASKELVKSNILRMEKNILDILNIDRLEKGLRLAKNDSVSNISTVTEETCNLFYDYAKSKGIEIKTRIENDLFTNIDEVSYMEALNNLLDNAIKYSESGGTIIVSTFTENGDVNISVKDDGIGISETDKEYVFKKYYQSHGNYGNYYGLGIGLAFTRKICELYNGEIYLESKLGIGSTFTIVFPQAEKVSDYNPLKTDGSYIPRIPRIPNELSVGAENRNSKLKTILIVEDNIEIRNLLTVSFKGKYNLLMARNGKEGVDQCRSVKDIDLIITDLMMPVMDGKEFIELLRNDIGDISTPVIFLTAKSGASNIVDCQSLGVIDIISKPFSIDELISKVDSIFNVLNNN